MYTFWDVDVHILGQQAMAGRWSISRASRTRTCDKMMILTGQMVVPTGFDPVPLITDWSKRMHSLIKANEIHFLRFSGGTKADQMLCRRGSERIRAV